MILTVTPNAALDITYEIERLVPGTDHRVKHALTRAGGKGVNVTSVLMAMGYASLATGFVGGPPGQTILADLTDRGVPHLFTDVLGSSRRNVKVHDDDGTMTLFNEPGPTITPLAWDQLLSSVEPLITGPATALVVSGKLPSGSPDDSCAGLLSLAHEHHVPTLLDVVGNPLRALLPLRPSLVKVNRRELGEIVGPSVGLLDGARELQRMGARIVVVTLAGEGLYLIPDQGPVLRAWLTEPQRGYPTGSGDAVTAALSTGIGEEPWDALVRRAVVWAGASVRLPVTGFVEASDVAELEALSRVEEVTEEQVAALVDA